MPICPWKHLIVFSFGAGSCILLASLIGTVAYNGKFGDNNKFLKYRFGRDQKIGQLTIANVSLAFICACFLLLTLLASVKLLPGALILTGWILTFLCFLGTIISQILSLTESKYGDAILPSEYDYLSKSKFTKYLNEAGYEAGRDYKCSEILSKGFHNATSDTDELFSTSIYYPFEAFMIPYYSSGKLVHVPSCRLAAEPFGVLSGNFPGIDPCNYVIDDSNGRCIGGWSVGNFKNYWCYEYRHSRDFNKTVRQKSAEDLWKYSAEKNRAYASVTSYNAFYEINTIFLGLNCAGFFVTLIGIFLNMAFRPFDTNVEDYQKLVAGQEAKSDDSSKAQGSNKPVRAKVISESEDED